MSKYKKTNFKLSLKNAVRGIELLWKSEKNFRTHCIITVLVLLLALLFSFDAKEMCILILTISIVILSEIFNSAIEFTLDAVYKNKYSRLVGMAKDISAAAVTISAMFSIIIGLFLFGNHLFD
jgi:diacylglycerol kinase